MRSLTNESFNQSMCREACVASSAYIRHVLLLLAVSLVVWIGAASAMSGQCSWELLYTFDGEAAGDMFGFSVSGAGDVNNDGYDDLILGGYGNDAGGTNAGRAYVYSGRTRGLLWTLTGETVSDRFGYSVSGAGDVNNDGYDDLIVGAPGSDAGGTNAGQAHVYSGQTGGLLWTFTGEAEDDQFGWSVSGAGDVNNDGYDDLIVGAPWSEAEDGDDYAGRAYIYCGRSGSLLWTLAGEAVADNLGFSVSGAGDTDDDGYGDWIVGAPNSPHMSPDEGWAYVYSGKTGGSLWILTGWPKRDGLGYSVSGIGDVDVDGCDDFSVGAPRHDAGGDDAGRAYIYSGQTADLLRTFTGEAPFDHFGSSVSAAGDVNDDGFPDLIVGARHNDAAGENSGRAYVYSGLRGGLLCTFSGQAPFDQFGHSVSAAGDVNNDGYDELIVGAPYNDAAGLNAGRAYVYACQVAELYFCGDCAEDDLVDVADVIYLIGYLCTGLSPPAPLCIGDVNCDGVVDGGDVIYLINYLFLGTSAPCSECCAL